jgi:rod shape-determining protein MreD
MNAGALQRLDLRLRQALPVLLTLAVVVLSVAPLRLPDYALVAPGLVLIALFFWTVHRPDLLRPWHAFAIGLFDDVLSGTPLGVNALIFVLAHAVIVAQHKVFRGKPFAVIWFAFVLLALAAQLATAALALAAARVLVDPLLLVVQLALTIGFYPPLAWLLGRAQRAFLAGI